ncbi:cell division protein ZapA [Plastoroseomonas hellenica]|uniref:Cell division protein ZapA n=1 Tax=Plastoroseomonas hellenica TaxID=2687306 RepID=A0ABS5F8P5_9PROT|nr:cell division protein ZapA [Plastoroseomonas hellenica]MBR0647027.1 cell division protein ZapA [Plastoroseomonas hellenica]MBR0668939.1 cell division protein ZapA [Plastoroseomonas hellenica]
MAQVTVRIGGYSHPVSCQDGQEQHLQKMAAEVDRRVAALKAMGLQLGETRMLVLAALQLADETYDMRDELAALRAGAPAGAPAPAAEPDPALAVRLAAVAERIEAIAGSLEAP